MVAPVAALIARGAATIAPKLLGEKQPPAVPRSQRRLVVDVKFLGDKALEKKLKRLAGKQQRAIVRKALRKGGKLVEQEAKDILKPHRKTGALEKSIKLRAAKRSRRKIGVRVVAGAETGGSELDTGYVSFVELGWEDAEAIPFLRKAREKKRREFDKTVAKEIGNGITELAQR